MLRSLSSSLSKVNASLRAQSYRSIGSVFRPLQSTSIALLQSKFVPVVGRLVYLSSFRSNESNEDIDRSLLRLDNEIRRTGRVARQEIDEILQDIRDMKKATSSQSLMIIRCCGELVPSETPENRTKLVQEVWKTMQNLNVPIDVSHYNALLRVYLENEHKFNPTEFLQELAAKGVEPNRVTYQRLIARFCQEGDIDGASTILQHMKEKQLPINEHVFNALVNGHARADDMDSAEGIISVMKQAGLEPNDDTYATLMCGYARKGDIDNINRIVKECNDKDVHLIDRDFLSVIFTLSANGHENLVENMIRFLKKQSGFNQDATNLTLRLVSIGKEDVAYKILKEMTPVMRNEEVLPSGNFFIGQLVRSTPSETIVKFCKLLKDDGLNSFALSKACDFSLQFKLFDKAFDLLEAFKESGAPIRQHYFWPFFASAESEKGIYDGLKCMKYLEIPPSNETLRDYVIPSLFKHSKSMSAEKTLDKLSNYTGIALRVLVPAAMQYLLLDRNIEQATQFAAKYRLRFANPMLRRAVVDAYLRESNPKMFVQIVGSAGLDGEDNAREIVGMMIMELLESCRHKEKAKHILPIMNELLQYGIGLSNSGSGLIQNNLGDELTPEIANLIVQLTSSDLTPKLESFMPPKGTTAMSTLEDKSITELEQLHEEALKAGKPTKGLKKAMLFGYCRQRQLEKAEAIKGELVADGFVFPTGLQALLLDLYSQCNKLDEAKETYSTLMSQLETPIDDLKILHYAALLAANDQLKECIDVLKNTPRDESRKPLGAVQQATVWKILNAIADKGQVENLHEVFQVLKDRNLMHINNVTLGPLVKAYIVKDDLEGALAEFERCVEEHHATPWKQELFCRFIKAEDTDRLQKVIDLSTTLHGEVNSMYDLVFAFIQCGKLRQAKKILETPGLRARNDKIELTCQKYLDENRVGELENLIQITKDNVNLDRNSMYFYLLQSYCKAGEVDKALSVWTSLQEENIQPTTELLSFLADFLRKNNRPVPFVMEESTSESSKVTGSTSRGQNPETKSLLTKFRQSIEANEIDIALQIKQRLHGSGTREKLTLTDKSSLIEKMARAERLGEATKLTEEVLDEGMHPYPRTMRFFFGRLATAGEVDVLHRFENKLTPDLKRNVMFNTRLAVAYTNAGRGKEYFENYIKKGVQMLNTDDKGSTSSVPLSGSTYILIRNEDLLSEFEEVAAKAEQKGNQDLHSSLWNFYLLKKNFAKARELWETKLKAEPRIIFRSVMVEAKIKQDEEIGKELMSHLAGASNTSSTSKGSACSCVLDILCAKGKPEEALQYLQSNLGTLQLQDLNANSLHRLKESLEAAKKTFPYEIPPHRPRGTRPRRTPTDGGDSDEE